MSKEHKIASVSKWIRALAICLSFAGKELNMLAKAKASRNKQQDSHEDYWGFSLVIPDTELKCSKCKTHLK